MCYRHFPDIGAHDQNDIEVEVLVFENANVDVNYGAQRESIESSDSLAVSETKLCTEGNDEVSVHDLHWNQNAFKKDFLEGTQESEKILVNGLNQKDIEEFDNVQENNDTHVDMEKMITMDINSETL